MRGIIIFCFLGILCADVSAQYVYTIKADSVKITNCDSSELILENHTQGVPGFLFNTGNGRTQFKHGMVSLGSGSYLFGADTLNLGTNAWLQGGNSFGTNGVLGTLDNNPLDLYANNSLQVRVTTGGHLLVGTTWDAGALTVQGNTVFNGTFQQGLGSPAYFGNGLQLTSYGSNSEIYAGTELIFQSQNQGDQHLFINTIGQLMTGNLVTMNPGAYPFTDSQMVLKVVNEDQTCALCVAVEGNVGVGQPYPTALLHVSGTVRFDALTNDSTQTRVLVSDASGNLYYRSAASLAANDIIRSSLAVNGPIRAERLTLSSPGWADYVFDSSYRRWPLADVEAYIHREHHLPDLPSASEVRKNGIDVGANQTALLKKIEELTLYRTGG
jgi:hypothetical protein